MVYLHDLGKWIWFIVRDFNLGVDNIKTSPCYILEIIHGFPILAPKNYSALALELPDPLQDIL